MSRPDHRKNLRSEKEGFNYLRKALKGFRLPTSTERKNLLKSLDLPEKYARSFDAVILKNSPIESVKNPSQIHLLEVKVTKKHLPNFPKGFFFGMTKNEEELLKNHGGLFVLCLVSLNDIKNQHLLLSHSELSQLIRVKRVQYQINL